jgi:hypothetical protein
MRVGFEIWFEIRFTSYPILLKPFCNTWVKGEGRNWGTKVAEEKQEWRVFPQ